MRFLKLFTFYSANTRINIFINMDSSPLQSSKLILKRMKCSSAECVIFFKVLIWVTTFFQFQGCVSGPSSLTAAPLGISLSTGSSGFGSSWQNTPSPPEVFRGKICIGTNGRMSVPSNRSHHYRNLKDRYTNCTYVEGNLELTWISDLDMDLSFLEHIREVTGYVLISHVDVRRIIIPNLQVIRGRTRFRLNVHDDEFALMVTLSRMDNLELPGLRDVLAGNVGIFNNYNLCHVKTINWNEIISGVNAKYVYVYNYTQSERDCPPCHSSCESGCWGEGKNNCQKFSKLNCSPQCHEGRCYGLQPRECCHLSCAGGCTGPKKSDCLACKNFYDDGECKDECPSLVIYNPNTYLSERNPAGKYAYGATCVKTCPDHLLRDAGAGACVRQCPRDKETKDGECVPCTGPCRKKCQGPHNAVIHSGNIESFRNCTIIEGSIQILESTFNGFQEFGQNYEFGAMHAPMSPDKLEVFSTLREVTGFIDVQAAHPNFTNLKYFRNLEEIGGRQKAESFAALSILKTSLRSLNLRSLRKIRAGFVTILENENLCFADTINWFKIVTGKSIGQIQNNKRPEDCQKYGQVCSSQCSADGCWDLEPRDCISCAKFKLGEQCIPSCNTTIGGDNIYEDSKGICKHCHEQCLHTCNGAGPRNCTKCKNVRDGPFCVSMCPESKYKLNGECFSCHHSCVDGCTGPENGIGLRGCNSCQQAIVDENERIVECLGKDEPCPDGYYYESVSPKSQGALKPMAGKAVCKKCHPWCKKCTAYGFHKQVCQDCTFFRRGQQCEGSTCPADYYPNESTLECLPCMGECRECTGQSVKECINCRHYRIYSEDAYFGNEVIVNGSFTCVYSCPANLPEKIVDGDVDAYCRPQTILPPDERTKDPKYAIIFGAVVCLIVLAIFATTLCLFCMREKSKKNTEDLILKLSEYDPNEPLRPTNIKPNLAKFRTIKEEDLRKGGFLGAGAFGTVYKGVWIPEGQNVKIPVAIKVLKDGPGSCKEFLDEAYIMASVEHPNLLKLLSVCLTSQLMLVTQLMPLGCLRDYVQRNKDKIGSKDLLSWCTQIAKGMAFLESHRLVHRDLAARNVLVQSPRHVKITDFGLAKLLELDENEFKSEGGKMPIKWLALECLRDRTFTHKTDVWAFGVTVWELLSYGERPYENTAGRDLAILLEAGHRLNQPLICTLELFMVIIKCWLLNPTERPSFNELVNEFTKMSRDPGRYVVINGDKLMRLPSYTRQDERDLIRDLSSTLEGPEIIMDATEYLQNQNSNTSFSSANGTVPKGNAYLTDPSWTEAYPPSTQGRRYYPGRPIGSLRYISDPLKNSSGDDSSIATAEESLRKYEANVGNIKLDLPVDEDDYLMPSPQNNKNASTYLHIVGDSSRMHGAEQPVQSAAQGKHYPILVDNPEYQLTAREYTNVPLAYAPIGLPPCSSSSSNPLNTNPNLSHLHNHNSLAPTHTTGENAQHFAQKQYRPPSSSRRHGSRSEEESDHEYYNDLERLKREKQPLHQLRKNETTV